MKKIEIVLKDELSEDEVNRLTLLSNKAFNNRAGKIVNTGSGRVCIYKDEGKDFGALSLGFVNLKDVKNYRRNVKSWRWIDEENPKESSDILSMLNRRYGIDG